MTRADVEAAVEMFNEGLDIGAPARIIVEARHVRFSSDGFQVATDDGAVEVRCLPDRFEVTR